MHTSQYDVLSNLGNNMANITLDIANTGEKVPVLDIDLESVTNVDLIEAALTSDILRPITDWFGNPVWNPNVYKIIGKNNAPVIDEATLSSLGFADGDTIRVVTKPI